MSESLALIYRPNKFEDVVGQGSTVQILKNQLINKDIKQAYLFKGAGSYENAQTEH